jgi:hypothetical protein
MKALTILALFFALTFTACNPDDIFNRLAEKVKETEKKEDDKKKEDDRKKEEPCFQIVFPMSYEMPNGDIITGESREDLHMKMNAWHKEHPDVREKATMVFPITIVYWDGKELIVNNQEEFKRAHEPCMKDKDPKKDKDRPKGPCFKFVFPLMYVMPDGTEIVGENEKDLDMQIKAWFRNNPNVDGKPVIAYPFTIVYWDGKELVVNNEEEFKAAHEPCMKDKDPNKDDDRDPNKDDDRDPNGGNGRG